MNFKNMERKRIFIAINIPDDLKNTLEARMKPFYGEKTVRVSKKEGWHITVVFCGYLNETETDILGEILNETVSRFRVFSLLPLKIVFAPEGRPRMVWLEFSGSKEFKKLKIEIEGKMRMKQRGGFFSGFRPENRSVLPHLTLSRFEEKNFYRLKNLLPEEGIDLSGETGPVRVESVDITESRLSRDGAEYALIEKFNFKS